MSFALMSDIDLIHILLVFAWVELSMTPGKTSDQVVGQNLQVNGLSLLTSSL